jgi:hypothetical protein
MCKTSRRVQDRWETGLFWKEHEFNLPKSRPQPEGRLHLIEKNMDKDPDFAESYKFVEYEEKKYIKNLSQEKASVVTPNIFLISLPKQAREAKTRLRSQTSQQNRMKRSWENVYI